MQHRRFVLASAVIAVVALTGCSQTSEALGEASGEAARVVAVKGTGLREVILTRDAYMRLGVATDQVRRAPDVSGTGSAPSMVIPSSAVLFDAQGRTWTYTVRRPRTFVRAPVTIDHFGGLIAYLRSGPAVGTLVVTVGAPELMGAELGVEGE